MITRISVLDLSFDQCIDFAKDCIDRMYEGKFNSDNIIQALNGACFFVNRQNKNIGFIHQTIDEHSHSITFDYFLSPRACNLALLPIIRSGIIRSILLESIKYNGYKIYFEVSSEVVVDSLKRTFGDVFNIFFLEENLISVEVLTDLIKTHLPNLLDRSFYIGFDSESLTFSFDI